MIPFSTDIFFLFKAVTSLDSIKAQKLKKIFACHFLNTALNCMVVFELLHYNYICLKVE